MKNSVLNCAEFLFIHLENALNFMSIENENVPQN